jgi:uncharacterized DUF497 family protein
LKKGSRYDWDENNLAHIARHNVAPEEFEQVLANDRVFSGEDFENGERRVRELGATDAGRVLIVVWTPRGNLTRPITAWDVNRRIRAAWNETRNRINEQAKAENAKANDAKTD